MSEIRLRVAIMSSQKKKEYLKLSITMVFMKISTANNMNEISSPLWK